MNKKYTILLLILFLLTSCSPNITPYATKLLGNERVYQKNYSLRVKKFSYVGEPMIRVRDYLISKSTTPEVIASSNSIITGGNETISIIKDKKYRIIGETIIKNKKYRIIEVPSETNIQISYGIIINDDGQIQGDVIFYIAQATVTSPDTFSATNNLKFIDTKEEKIIPTQGNMNYELIYSGKNSESIFIKYREYTEGDLARDAFFQDLTYSVNSKKIRFKNIEIIVEDVTNEQIKFTVVSDGLQNEFY